MMIGIIGVNNLFSLTTLRTIGVNNIIPKIPLTQCAISPMFEHITITVENINCDNIKKNHDLFIFKTIPYLFFPVIFNAIK